LSVLSLINPINPEAETEWLVANGLGGYAAGTVTGVITRGFHGYLVAALPSPLGRMMMLNDVVEQITTPDFTKEFRLDDGLPVWRYHVDGFVIEKRLVLPHMQNTVFVN